MLEILMTPNKKVSKTGYLFYTDFETQAVGNKDIIDQSEFKIALPMIGNAGNSNFGVVDHPTIGKCFQFGGQNHFYNADNPLKDMSLGNYDIEIGYLKPNTAYGTMVTSGAYSSLGLLKKGWVLVLEQFVDSHQFFLTDVFGAFQRDILPGANSLKYTELLIEKRSSGTKITNKTTGVTATFQNYTTGGDSHLTIGGSDSSDRFSGFIKYLGIKKVLP